MRFGKSAESTTDYAADTYESRWFIVRYPHVQRFNRAVETIQRLRPDSMLDYGAGDGQLFLRLLASGSAAFPGRVVAFEPWNQFAASLRDRVERAGVADRVRVVQDTDLLREERFQLISCLSVLEHLPLQERQKFYAICDDHLADDGRILIEVPIEIGVTLLIKELVRVGLKGREADYSARRLIRTALGIPQYDPARYDPRNTATWVSHHDGFDYRLLAGELASRFTIIHTFPTPFRRVLPWLGNQELFFVLRKSDGAGAPSRGHG